MSDSVVGEFHRGLQHLHCRHLRVIGVIAVYRLIDASQHIVPLFKEVTTTPQLQALCQLGEVGQHISWMSFYQAIHRHKRVTHPSILAHRPYFDIVGQLSQELLHALADEFATEIEHEVG